MNLLEKMDAEIVFEKTLTSGYWGGIRDVFKVGNYVIVFWFDRPYSSADSKNKASIYDFSTGELIRDTSFSSQYYAVNFGGAHHYLEDDEKYYIFTAIKYNNSEGELWRIELSKETLGLNMSRTKFEHESDYPFSLTPSFYNKTLYATHNDAGNQFRTIYQDIMDFNSFRQKGRKALHSGACSEILRSDENKELPFLFYRSEYNKNAREYEILSMSYNNDTLVKGELSTSFRLVNGFFKINGDMYVIVTALNSDDNYLYKVNSDGTSELIRRKKLPGFHSVYGDYLVGAKAIYNIYTNHLYENDEDNALEILGIKSSDNLIFTKEGNARKFTVKVYETRKSDSRASVKLNDKWLDTTELLVKTNESWKKVSGMYTKINGVWR